MKYITFSINLLKFSYFNFQLKGDFIKEKSKTRVVKRKLRKHPMKVLFVQQY